MKYIIPIILIFTALYASSPAQERKVVATVDASPIYLDEIGAGQQAQQGEIKFVDPDLSSGQADFDTQIKLLKIQLADKILQNEIRNRAITPSDEAVQRELDKYAEQQWQALFPNEQKKKEVLKKMQVTGLKILEGLTIWKQDKQKGDIFAQTQLMPLGMTPEAWTFYTNHANDPEIIGKLKKWENIDNMSKEEIKEFLFLTNNQEHYNKVRYVLSKEALKSQVIQNNEPSPDQIGRFFELLQNTESIDIVIIPKDAPEIKELRSLDKSKRASALPAEYKSSIITLPRVSDGKGTTNKGGLTEFMILATYADSLDPGTISSLVQVPTESKGPESFVVFIYDIKSKSQKSQADSKTNTRLNNELTRFNRDLEFSNWLHSEIRLRTEILLPEYNSALSN